MIEMHDDFVRSLEFQFLINRAVAASRSGRTDISDLYARAAERLLGISLPGSARDVSLIASRKGAGTLVAGALVKRLTPTQAAAVAIVWTLRGARKPALQRLTEAFRGDETFGHTLRTLCPPLRL